MIFMNHSKQSNLKIVHDRVNCIGCAACVCINFKEWKMNSDGKSDLLGSKDNDDGTQVKEIKSEDKDINMECAYSCPVNVIHVIEDDEKLI